MSYVLRKSAGRLISDRILVSFLLLGAAAAGCAPREGPDAGSSSGGWGWLLTPEEIEELERDPEGVRVRGPICDEPGDLSDPGPRIELLEPEVTGGSITAPFPVHIRFVPRRSPVDRGSLRVTVRYQLPLGVVKSLDITDRVEPDWEKGAIREPELEARPGCYQLELSLADEEGRESFLIQGFRVKRS